MGAPNGSKGTPNGSKGTPNGSEGTPNGSEGTTNGSKGTPNGSKGTTNGSDGRYAATRVLFTDYTNVEIWSQCYVENFTSGLCDIGHIEVMTRRNPNKLSADDVAAVNKQIDLAVAPYCLSSANFN
ncbi:hypothetical protein BV898_09641 [Hypsibius exemplaris]|uniref:Uncharacterized protein n=1 Tax=Hypsibius exemplaris TaxID=2072580 RepID=A0A1W0WLX0_HYPEX|nr:hypothetical protein BV898_09641 [Hypsibius exemplaris]